MHNLLTEEIAFNCQNAIDFIGLCKTFVSKMFFTKALLLPTCTMRAPNYPFIF